MQVLNVSCNRLWSLLCFIAVIYSPLSTLNSSILSFSEFWKSYTKQTYKYGIIYPLLPILQIESRVYNHSPNMRTLSPRMLAILYLKSGPELPYLLISNLKMKDFSVFTHFNFTELTVLSDITIYHCRAGAGAFKYFWVLVLEILLISKYD